jgi:hypothetical protein
MEHFMNIKTLLLGAVVAAGALTALAAPASAYIACNRDGDCWHTESRYRAPGVRFDYHPDDYYFHQRWDGDQRRHWREHREGRGYYRNGIWITL